MGSRANRKPLPVSRVKAMAAVSGGVAVPDYTTERESDKFVRMAGAMDEALDKARSMWLLLCELRDRHSGDGKTCRACDPANWKPLIDETERVAAILQRGLKARASRGPNRA